MATAVRATARTTFTSRPPRSATTGDQGTRSRRLGEPLLFRAWDSHAHDPAPLGDAAVTDEPELLEQALRSGMQVGAALWATPVQLLRVGLDHAAACLPDRAQCRRESRPRHTLATVPAAGEDAADPPVGQVHQLLLIRRGVLDRGNFGRRPELTPAHTFIPVIHQHLVHGAVSHVRTLGLAVTSRRAVLADPLAVEPNAPATTPDAVVRLNQRREVSPGIGSKQFGRVVSRPGCHRPTLPRTQSVAKHPPYTLSSLPPCPG